LGTDGEMQGIERIRTALGAHMWPGLTLKAQWGARGAPMQGLSQLMGLAGSHASHVHEDQPDSPHSSSASDHSTDSDDSDPASLDPTHFPYHRLDDAPDPAIPHSPPAHPSLASAPCANSAGDGSVPAGDAPSAPAADAVWDGAVAGVGAGGDGKEEERKEKEEGNEADEDFGPDKHEGVHPFGHGDADEARADMDGMERLFLQVASVRSSLQNAPDAVRRDTAARLAMQIAQMMGGDDDDAWE
ncbi:unnamed protein product, partial [Closterium sp. Naga37s-1]